MVCTKCGSELDGVSQFCSNCGQGVEKEAKPRAMPTSEESYHDYGGTRGSKKIGKTKFHYGQAAHKDEVGQAVEVYLKSNGYKPKMRQQGKNIIIEVKKINFFKYILGMNKSATVTISVSGNNLVTSIGEPQWIDKIIGLIIGWFMLGILWLFVAYGTYDQWKLFNQIDGEIETFLDSKK